MRTLSKTEWTTLSEQHRSRVHSFSAEARARASRREKHPVYDFLTQYYPFPLGRFEKWHPGLNTTLKEADSHRFPPPKYLYDQEGNASIDRTTLIAKERQRHTFTHQLLQNTQNRPAHFSCLGLHEWAMVYSGAEIRHRQSAPLRLTQAEIDALVKSRPLTCTHFDAYRFFSPQAQPMNAHHPTLHDRIQLEQPGCIHANMDLYKWASKGSPWVSSDLIWDCFKLALKARIIDMRASPYDLSTWGYAPICIETEEGRAQYITLQKEIESAGRTLRNRLLSTYAQLLQ